MGAPQFMIRTVDGSSNMDKPLPDFQSLDVSAVFSQASAIVVKYPKNGVNFNLLDEDTELAITLDGVEVPTLRCIVEAVDGNDADEASDGAVWTFTCRTTMALFDRAVIYPLGWPLARQPTVNYTTASAGEIINNLLFKAQSRGALAGVTTDFTASLDSNGHAWAVTFDSVDYDVGIKYSEVMQSMVDGGYAEFVMTRRVLSAYNPGTLGVDKSTGAAPLTFHAARDMKESPRKVSTRDLATSLLLNGSNNSYAETESDPSTMSMWGRREGYSSANISDMPDVLEYLAAVKLETLNVPLMEITHGLFFDDDSNPRPITNFGVGDWGLSDVGYGWEKYRIKQWVLSIDNGGSISGSVTLNDLISEQIEKLNARLGKLENGTSSAGSSQETDDLKAPAAPLGVNITTDYYVDNGWSRAFITVDWLDVTTNFDGTPADDVSYYLARWRYFGDSNWQQTARTDVTLTEAYFAGIITNRVVEAQVQAVDRWSHASAWSISATVTTARDLLAPVKPSAPVVTSNVGTLRVVWDGTDYLGQQQVADFDGVEVHVGTTGTFTPTSGTLKDYLRSRTTVATTITGLAYGTDWFVRLIAVDTSNNKSSPSDSNSTSHAVLNQVVTTEIGTGQVGLAQTAFSDVGNLIDDGNFEIPSQRVSRQAQMTGTHFAFDSSTSSNGGWSVRHDSWAGGDTSEAIMLQGSLPVKPGERVFGAADYRSTTDIPTSPTASFVSLVILWRDISGVYLDGTTGLPNPAYLGVLSDNWWGVVDNTWHSRVTGISKVAPPNATMMEIWLHTAHRTAGTIWIDAVEIRRQIDTLLIQQAAITTALIADLAVNNAKINDLSVGKLTAGTLGADIIVGARIKTANTGARVEMNTSGIQVFNSANAQTGSFASADGSINLVGTLVSGTAGTRIEINPAGVPTIRLYSGAGTEFGFINGFTISGTDVGVGFNSSPFSGNSTQLVTRLVAFASQVSIEVVKSSNQQVSGGYMYATPTDMEAGYSILGTQGGNMILSANDVTMNANGSNTGALELNSAFARFGIKGGTSTENVMYFESGLTRHYGRWENNAGVSGNTQGLYTGRVAVGAGFSSLTITYGATMSTAMVPMATLAHANFDNTTGTSTTSPIWGVSAGSGGTTSFAIGWDKGLAVACHFWVFRI